MSNLSSFNAFLTQPAPLVADSTCLLSKTLCGSIAQWQDRSPQALWDLQHAAFPSTPSATGAFVLLYEAKGDTGALMRGSLWCLGKPELLGNLSQWSLPECHSPSALLCFPRMRVITHVISAQPCPISGCLVDWTRDLLWLKAPFPPDGSSIELPSSRHTFFHHTRKCLVVFKLWWAPESTQICLKGDSGRDKPGTVKVISLISSALNCCNDVEVETCTIRACLHCSLWTKLVSNRLVCRLQQSGPH